MKIFFCIAIFFLPSPAIAQAPCRASQLALQQGAADAAMSKVSVTFTVTNYGAQPCRLAGTPGVRARDDQGNRLHLVHPAPATQQVPASPVVVASGKVASFSIYFGTSGPYDKGQCPGRTKELLVLFPQNGGIGKVNVDLDICTRIRVSAFSAGKGE